MKRIPTLLLKTLIILVAGIAVTALIRFPQTEGRAANLDLISIYADPLIIYSFIMSIPFFVGLYQAFTFLGYVEKSKVYSKAAIKAVTIMKNCALITPFLLVAADVFIILNAVDEDFVGPIALSMYVSVVCVGVAVVLHTFGKRLSKHAK